MAAVVGGGSAAYLLRETLPRAFDFPALHHVHASLVSVRVWTASHAGARAALGVLPDVAWAFALGWMISRLWPLASRARSGWLAIGLVLACGWEVAQGVGLVRGTFDYADLVGSAAAYALAAWIASHRIDDPRPMENNI